MIRTFWSFILLLALTGVALADSVAPLVDVAWVKANAARADVVVLDVRNKLGKSGRADYEAGHIPGAIHSDYLKDGWRTKVAGVPGQLPPPGDLEKLIGGLGIGNDDHVVVVAGGTSALDMGSATRVYFTFKVLGHDRVSVLDGGQAAYTADPNAPLETGWTAPTSIIFTANFRPELLAGREEVAAALGGEAALIDFRPPPQFRGERKHPAAKRAGTIPTAQSIPERNLIENRGHLVSAVRMTTLLEGVGLASRGEQIAFCNTGHWASLGWFVSREILGNKQTKLYDGSMVEWTADAGNPVENHARALAEGEAEGGDGSEKTCATC